MTILAIDISHYQGTPDFHAVKAAGIGLVVMKATESTTYTDPAVSANQANARAAGLTVGFYHFARATNAVAEADHFCNVLGSLTPGDIVALDWEVPGSDPVGWSLAWLAHVESRLGVKPLIYMNKSAEANSDWGPVVRNNNGLWLADYDFAPQVVPNSSHWPFVALKQYSDRGVVSGIAGGVDLDVFEGDAAQLAKYGYQGQAPAPAPTPAPTPPPSGRVEIAVYVVKSGDNLTLIAKRFPEADVTAASIAADNHLADPNRLQIGQRLVILSAEAQGGDSLPTLAYGQTSNAVRD